MEQLTLKAFAKINLSLKIISRRPDGYHDIVSIMQSISLCDRISIKKTSAKITIICNVKAVPTDNSNIAYKAAAEFLNEMRRRKSFKSGVEILIDKNIPVGAGLAGGSANAAAVLVGLNKLFATGYDIVKLQEIGANVGSDVPFCVVGGRARVSGRGEKITLKKVDGNQRVVLVNPGFKILTRWAYKELDRSKPIKLTDRNDFEAVVFNKYPEVLKIKNKLKGLGANFSQMTGSGPTVFGLFSDEKIADQAYKKLLAEYPQVFLADYVERGVKIEK